MLVGKLPDQKSKIEQITLALIYKFMDDMDKEAVEKFKGKAKFFTGEYAKYGWRKLFDPSLSGIDMLALYSEALELNEQENNEFYPMVRSNRMYKTEAMGSADAIMAEPTIEMKTIKITSQASVVFAIK